MRKRGILLIGVLCLTGFLACKKPAEEQPAEVAPPTEAPALTQPEATTQGASVPEATTEGGAPVETPAE